MKKILCFLLALTLIILAACSSSADKPADTSSDMMHFQFKDVQYSVPDSWVDNTDDPDMYVHTAGDDSIALAVMTSEVDPDTMTFFEYLDSQNIQYEPLAARIDGVTVDGAEYKNDDGDLIHSYYFLSNSGQPYMIHVYLFSDAKDEEAEFLKSITLND